MNDALKIVRFWIIILTCPIWFPAFLLYYMVLMGCGLALGIVHRPPSND
jgi:hypothetical protein